ncbi:MAG: hypothetical protein KDE00_09575 [Rhodobacteraceae bacterium]|nr:hypothetical protein [Paracoccaceae bacterium]
MTPAAVAPAGQTFPLISPLLRALAAGSAGTILSLILVLALLALGLAVATWGVMALSLAALACVPVCFVLLILVSLGK